MAKKRSAWDHRAGHWAFLIGIALAMLAGLVPQMQTQAITWALVLLGLVVGLLNITAKETKEFLIACVALVIVADAAAPLLGPVMAAILGNIVTFVFPAAFVVAFKSIWTLASEE